MEDPREGASCPPASAAAAAAACSRSPPLRLLLPPTPSPLPFLQADNFYYPPGWDPSKGSLNKVRAGGQEGTAAAAARRPRPSWLPACSPPACPARPAAAVQFQGSHGALGDRARKLKSEGILVIRFEMPFNVWCAGCNHLIGKVRPRVVPSDHGLRCSSLLHSMRCTLDCCSSPAWGPPARVHHRGHPSNSAAGCTPTGPPPRLPPRPRRACASMPRRSRRGPTTPPRSGASACARLAASSPSRCTQTPRAPSTSSFRARAGAGAGVGGGAVRGWATGCGVPWEGGSRRQAARGQREGAAGGREWRPGAAPSASTGVASAPASRTLGHPHPPK